MLSLARRLTALDRPICRGTLAAGRALALVALVAGVATVLRQVL